MATIMQEKIKNVQKTEKEEQIQLDNKIKKDFLTFLKQNEKDISTGFGAFHTDNHSNW